MNGFHETSGTAATTEASNVWPVPAETYSAEEIAILVDRAKRLRAEALRTWGRNFAESLRSVWRRPGRLIPQPAR